MKITCTVLDELDVETRQGKHLPLLEVVPLTGLSAQAVEEHDRFHDLRHRDHLHLLDLRHDLHHVHRFDRLLDLLQHDLHLVLHQDQDAHTADRSLVNT